MEEGGERGDEESDDAPIPPDPVIFPKKLSLSLIGIGPTQPRHPKRKKDSSKFVRSKDKGHKSDRLLDEFKKKIHNLRLKRSMKIWFTAKCTSDAYRCLHIYSDPRGFTINYDDQGDSFDPQIDMEYLILLRRLADSTEIRVTNLWTENYAHLPELVSGLSRLSRQDIKLSRQDIDQCLQEYNTIYRPAEIAEKWKHLKNFLWGPNSESEYLRDPNNFEQKLKMDYMVIGMSNISNVLKAFVSWWTSKSEQDKDMARSLITCGYEEAQKFNDNRLKEDYARGDYLKLKVDVAGKVGIINRIPEALANFHLPGHYEWSSDDF